MLILKKRGGEYMKKPIAEREEIVSAFVKQEIDKDTAARLLCCTKRTLENYVKNYIVYKTNGLVDHRRSNNTKLTTEQVTEILQTKRVTRGSSERHIRDFLRLPVHETTK